MQHILYFVISFFASVAGAICGIGGGVIIKPMLDLVGIAGVSTISFLSGCTVLAMSSYSVVRNTIAGESRVDFKICTFLAVGAAGGGVLGKQVFETLAGSSNIVGSVQAACLAVVTLGALVFTLKRKKIQTLHLENKLVCLAIGLVLGMISSFLGIGGGPINLVVLFLFFSMDTKTAAQNSLYIILFSQIASLVTTFVTHSVPEFEVISLILMIIGGIGGGMAGRHFNKKMDNKAVDKLFIILMVVIILICIYNTFRYMGVL